LAETDRTSAAFDSLARRASHCAKPLAPTRNTLGYLSSTRRRVPNQLALKGINQLTPDGLAEGVTEAGPDPNQPLRH
jgi:hypothetical protein